MENILIVGSGGREHALARSFANKNCSVWVTPGNRGMQALDEILGRERPVQTIPYKGTPSERHVLSAAKKCDADLVLLTQEDWLISPTKYVLEKEGYSVFGAGRPEFELESSKVFARGLASMMEILTPNFHFIPYSNAKQGIAVAQTYFQEGKSVFIKADGLSRGKGAIHAEDVAQVRDAIKQIYESDKKHGAMNFLVEECVHGEEFSCHVITDMKDFYILPIPQDNKRLLDADRGPNTGGMGAHLPALCAYGLEEKIAEVTTRTLAIIEEIHGDMRGIIFFNFMAGAKGELWLIEYNMRPGDPESQLLANAVSNLPELVDACARGELGSVKPEYDKQSHVCVVGALQGYPYAESMRRGQPVHIEYSAVPSGVQLYSSGLSAVRQNKKWYLRTANGRAVSAHAAAENLSHAQANATAAVRAITAGGRRLQFRTDIASRDIERITQTKLG